MILQFPLFHHHIPRTAGTSARLALFGLTHPSRCLEAVNGDALSNVNPLPYRSGGVVSGHFGWSAVDWLGPTTKVFTLLRDPADRQVSDYAYTRAEGTSLATLTPGGDAYLDLISSSTLDELIRTTDFLDFQDNLQVRYLAGASPATPGVEAVATRCGDAMLLRAMDALDRVDVVGVSERLEDSFDLLSFRLRLPPIDGRLRENTSERIPISKTLRKRIAEVNRFDVALYYVGVQRFEADRREMFAELDLPEDADRAAVHMALLERHLATQLPIKDAIVLMAEYACGNNWRRAERCEELGSWIRWSGPETCSMIQLRLDRRSKREVTLTFPFFASEEHRDELIVVVDRESMSLTKTYDLIGPLWVLSISFALPPRLTQEGDLLWDAPTEIVLTAGTPIDLEVGGGESLRTSFAIHRVRVSTDANRVESQIMSET